MKTSSKYFKKIPIAEILDYPDACLQNHIFNEQGTMLLPANVPIHEISDGLKDPRKIITVLDNAGFTNITLVIKNTMSTAEAADLIEQVDPTFRAVDPAVTEKVIQKLDDVSMNDLQKDFISNVSRDLTEQVNCTNQILFSLVSYTSPDSYATTHALNVSLLAGYLAKRLNEMGIIDSEIVSLAVQAGLVADLGKAHIPQEILGKEGPLSNEERKLMQAHAQKSVDMAIAAGITDKRLLDGIKYHHERWDGKGYPSGLKDEKIPIIARILAVADTFDAMTSNRKYSNAVSAKMAFNVIVNLGETAFDPAVCQAFITGIGIYPPGCVVQLSNGTVGTVMGSSTGNMMQPKILIEEDGEKKIIDLAIGGNKVYIVSVLDTERSY